MDPITAFQTLDLRVGRVLEASVNAKARKPSYVVKVDFGPDLGIKTSSAQLTVHYRPEELVGRQVVAAVNSPDFKTPIEKSGVIAGASSVAEAAKIWKETAADAAKLYKEIGFQQVD